MNRKEYSAELAEFKETESLESATRKLFKDLFGMSFWAKMPGKDIRDKHFKNHNFTFQFLTDALSNVEHVWDIGATVNTSNEEMAKADGTAGNKYSFLYVYACDVKPVDDEGETMSRGAIKALATAFNRIASSHNYYKDPARGKIDIPVVIVVRQGKFLSIATCERLECKYDSGEKVGKVTILRNINCSNPHPGHIQNLNKIAEKVKDASTYEDLYRKWLEAFSIGILSKPFFDEYREIYADIVALITNKRMVKHGNKWEEELDTKIPETEKIEKGKPILEGFSVFEDPEKAIRDYVKKLMGRIVFIQFLQKKGWMGVPVGDGWEGGKENFLQDLFAQNQTDTFVDDVLEPLFKDLNTNREENGYLANSTVGGSVKVPYLNGGLFEPDDYDKAPFPLPKEYMQKMLDFFAHYNFTIDENAPDDVEVAVDPEMLSVIFESLLEDNKEKGAFYTPKEIVEYMCRESLIAYLQTDEDDDETKERYRAFVTTHDLEMLKLEDVAGVEKKLKEIKVCDPAIGSGAFPMGMLKELFSCRRAIEKKSDKRSFLQIKKEIIQNSIYGVDIEKGAVDIARLRFWLSLIIDEETPDALPNMDFKIMQGNSLLEQYDIDNKHIITLNDIVEKNQQHVNRANKISPLFKGQDVITNLGNILRNYYSLADHEDKELAKRNIDECVRDYIRAKIHRTYRKRSQIVEHAKALDKLATTKLINQDFFLWHTWFADVFENGGFDIVIGNPPYIDSETMVANMPETRALYTSCYTCAHGNWDMFVVFMEKALQLCNKNGIFSYIIPNKIIAAKYADILRSELSKLNLKEIRDYSSVPVFANAAVYPVTILGSRNSEFNSCLFTMMADVNNVSSTIRVDSVSFSSCQYWDVFFRSPEIVSLVKKCLNNKKLDSHEGIMVTGAATVAEAYEVKQALVDTQSLSNSFKVVNTGTIDPYTSLWGISPMQYIKGKYDYPRITKQALNNINPNRVCQAESIKIIIAGMSKTIEAVYDYGETLAGKSTTIVIHRDTDFMKYVLAILNSRLVSFLISIMYSSIKMSGGFLNIGTREIASIPIPEVDEKQKKDIVNLIDKIIDCKQDNMLSDISALADKIDDNVFKIFHLKKNEIAMIPDNKQIR